MEKIVNIRLVYNLEKQHLLPKGQSVLGKMKGTMDSLTRFTSDILSSFRLGQYTLCVSFDIEKAYDTTWRYHILRTLHEFHFRGPLPAFIQNFLSSRLFKTRIVQSHSNSYVQEQEVPQGSVISCTLFSLAINQIYKPSHHLPLMVVDDLLVYSSGHHVPSLERRLQIAVSAVNRWAVQHGFKFSSAQTVSLLFHRKRCFPPPPPPRPFLDNRPIPSISSIPVITFPYISLGKKPPLLTNQYLDTISKLLTGHGLILSPKRTWPIRITYMSISISI